MTPVLLVLFYFLFPVLIIHLDKKYTLVNRIGTVVICYGMGLLIGNIGILPDGIAEFQENIYSFCVILAIPLLLFSLDIRKWISMAGKTMLSLVLGIASVIIMVILGYFLFRDVIPDIWKVSGVLVGFYSGGAPNAAVISLALDMEPEVFILTQTYDLVVGAVTLLFLMTLAQRFFLLFMRPYKPSDKEGTGDTREFYHDKYESYDGIFSRRIFLPFLAAVGLSILILGISAGISQLFFKELNTALVILGITTLGIAASFIPRVKQIEKTFQGGIYLILVFCLVFASMADISMFSMESMPLLVYILLAVPGALLLHGILSRIFKVDVDNFLIISVALSMSPPFVPVVASSLKNREIILPGLIIGLVGYAVGNYIGILMGLLIKSFG
ncbi:MAG: DUF819 family protein [Bacteroidales bacterium]|nr:DUF819 family protein [Bacteroidales bacterium]